jgi:hypothetical protein
MVMRAAWIPAIVLALCGPLLGCNSVLGIDSASLAPDASEDVNVDAPVTTNDDPLTCANYCKVVSQNCTGEYVEYLASEGDGGANDPCMFLCTNYLIRNPGTYAPPNGPEPVAMPPGQPATLACRLWHAHAAGTMPQSIHCRHAGPLGSEACGDPCAAFCSLDFSYCVDDNSVPTYASQGQCQSACLGPAAPDASPEAGFVYNDNEGDLVDNGGNQINSGNTLNCRLWHLETSIQEDMPSMHCWHTASPSENPNGTPGGPCGP